MWIRDRAMAKAWKDVGYHSNNGTKSVKKGLKIIKNESKSTAEAMTSNFSTAFKQFWRYRKLLSKST